MILLQLDFGENHRLAAALKLRKNLWMASADDPRFEVRVRPLMAHIVRRHADGGAEFQIRCCEAVSFREMADWKTPRYLPRGTDARLHARTTCRSFHFAAPVGITKL